MVSMKKLDRVLIEMYAYVLVVTQLTPRSGRNFRLLVGFSMEQKAHRLFQNIDLISSYSRDQTQLKKGSSFYR